MGQLWGEHEQDPEQQNQRAERAQRHGRESRGAEEHRDSAGRYSEGQEDRQQGEPVGGGVGAWGWIG